MSKALPIALALLMPGLVTAQTPAPASPPVATDVTSADI